MTMENEPVQSSTKTIRSKAYLDLLVALLQSAYNAAREKGSSKVFWKLSGATALLLVALLIWQKPDVLLIVESLTSLVLSLSTASR